MRKVVCGLVPLLDLSSFHLFIYFEGTSGMHGTLQFKGQVLGVVLSLHVCPGNRTQSVRLLLWYSEPSHWL